MPVKSPENMTDSEKVNAVLAYRDAVQTIERAGEADPPRTAVKRHEIASRRLLRVVLGRGLPGDQLNLKVADQLTLTVTWDADGFWLLHGDGMADVRLHIAPIPKLALGMADYPDKETDTP
jgi:hypothetical protein